MTTNAKASPLDFVEEIDKNELQYGEVVGRGAFGVVAKAVWRGITVAVKQIETENEKRAFVQELKQLSRVSHQNIVKLYGASTKSPIFLVMEFAECGSLYNLLHGTDPVRSYNTAHAVSWCLQTAVGISYLHNMKPKAIIHRDLKPPNLLLVKQGTVVKICDFGTAADMQTHMTNNKGSAAWMAPEVFEGNKYSEKCDVFSWGIVLWECFSRKKPFDEIGGPAFRIMWAVHSGTRPPLLQGMPECLEHLMTKCWSKNPVERPSMGEVVRVMNLIMPYYQDQVKPINFGGGFFLEEDDESDATATTNMTSKYQSLDTPDDDAVPGSMTSSGGPTSRQLSHRSSEVVIIEPEQEEQPVQVIEGGKASSRNSLSGGDSIDQTPPRPLSASVLAQDSGAMFSPRQLADTQDKQKRFSADVEKLGPVLEASDHEEPPPQPSARRRPLGHRRVGSHGNPAIIIDPQYQPQHVHPIPPYGNRMVTSTSHPGDHGDSLQNYHQPLHHSTSYSSSGSQPTPPPSFPQLDDNLKPLQPLMNSPESTVVFYKHVQLAEKYTELKDKKAHLIQKIEEAKRQLAREEQKKKENQSLLQSLQRLADENDELTKWRDTLKARLGYV